MFFTKKTAIYAVNLLLFLLLCFVWVHGYFINDRGKLAIDSGQRYIISLSDGKIISPEVPDIINNIHKQEVQEYDSALNIADSVSQGTGDIQKKENKLDTVEDKMDTTISQKEVDSTNNKLGKNDNIIVASDTQKKSKSRIAIVVSGIGLDSKLTTRVLGINEDITLSFAPYSFSKNRKYFDIAIAEGKTALIDLKLDSEDYTGDNNRMEIVRQKVLNIGFNKEEALQVIENIVSPAKGLSGLYIYGNKKFFSLVSYKNTLLDFLSTKGLHVVYSGKISELSGNSQSFVTDLVLDKSLRKENIVKKMYELEEIAKKNGYAIGIAHLYPVTLDVLQDWINNKSADVEIVSLGKLYDKK